MDNCNNSPTAKRPRTEEGGDGQIGYDDAMAMSAHIWPLVPDSDVVLNHSHPTTGTEDWKEWLISEEEAIHPVIETEQFVTEVKEKYSASTGVSPCYWWNWTGEPPKRRERRQYDRYSLALLPGVKDGLPPGTKYGPKRCAPVSVSQFCARIRKLWKENRQKIDKQRKVFLESNAVTGDAVDTSIDYSQMLTLGLSDDDLISRMVETSPAVPNLLDSAAVTGDAVDTLKLDMSDDDSISRRMVEASPAVPNNAVDTSNDDQDVVFGGPFFSVDDTVPEEMSDGYEDVRKVLGSAGLVSGLDINDINGLLSFFGNLSLKQKHEAREIALAEKFALDGYIKGSKYWWEGDAECKHNGQTIRAQDEAVRVIKIENMWSLSDEDVKRAKLHTLFTYPALLRTSDNKETYFPVPKQWDSDVRIDGRTLKVSEVMDSDEKYTLKEHARHHILRLGYWPMDAMEHVMKRHRARWEKWTVDT